MLKKDDVHLLHLRWALIKRKLKGILRGPYMIVNSVFSNDEANVVHSMP